MRSSQMARSLGAFSVLAAAGSAVLFLHGDAFAQQAEAEAKEEAPAPAKPAEAAPAPEAPADAAAKPVAPQDLPPDYAPTPGYGPRGYQQPQPPPSGYGYYDDYYYGQPSYPPPRYQRPRYRQPAPARYYPQPISYRPFFFGVGLGVGGVALFPIEGAGEASSRAGMSYNLRFGFGVAPRWSIVLSGDGAFSYFSPYDIDQSVWSIGPQVFLNRNIYARLGIGVATKSIDVRSGDGYYDYYRYNAHSDSGMGGTVAIGAELMQSYHVALGLEAVATFGHYQSADPITASKNSGTLGINFLLQLF